MILIGSRAAKLYFSDFRNPRDWDIICSAAQLHEWSIVNARFISIWITKNDWKRQCKLKNGITIEFEISDANPSSAMLVDEWNLFDGMTAKVNIPGIGEHAFHVPKPVYLYLIKRSHIYWNVNWNKNIRDLHALKKRIGPLYHVGEREEQFYQLRLAENRAKFGDFKAKLNVSNDKFFAKSEKSLARLYPHDELHQAVKYYDLPLYVTLKEDRTKALISKQLFDNASPLEQLRLVREEAMAIALERYVLTGRMEALEAYKAALRRICTNLTSGWFREFAIDNWSAIRAPDVNYVEKFEDYFKTTIKDVRNALAPV